MAIRFIIGRAGSGKTHHCLEAVRERLRHDPVHGPRLMLLVPEQAALQVERAIIEPADIGGAHRADVVSFRRLAHRILSDVTGTERQALSERARAMVLRHLIAQNAGRLQYYRNVDRMGGFVDRLAVTITELLQEAVLPDDLSSIADQAPNVEPAQMAKLHDLRTIYSAYLTYLGDERVDPSQQLQIARELMVRCEWIAGAELWVDGFASLMRQELLTLIELARMCQHVDITTMIDPSMYQGGGSSRRGVTEALFRKTYRTHSDLVRTFTEAGLEVEEPVYLNDDPLPRFARGTGLAQLESYLSTGQGSSNPNVANANSPDLELVELASRRIEVDYAVSRVIRWAQDPDSPCRYRDTAIIVRDLEPYHDLLAEALTSRHIPFFIDWRRRTAHHPLVELLRASIAIVEENFSPSSIRFLLKTGLLPISMESADELENYLLAHGLAGVDAWRGEDWFFVTRSSLIEHKGEPSATETALLSRINASRRVVWKLLQSWVEFASDSKGHAGAEWSSALTAWLDRLNAGETIEGWAHEAEDDGDLDQASEHRQVWRDTMSFLDDLAFALQDAGLRIGEVGRVLESGLSGFTLGLAPPMVDQVLVGSIERSRHPDIKAAVILGFNDGVFPAQQIEDSMLNDDDRALLTAGGLKIGLPSQDRTLDEALLIYIAMTRASRKLVVTYATSDDDGKALRPSPGVKLLQSACAGLEVTRLGDPSSSRATWDILSSSDLNGRIASEMRHRPERHADEAGLRARWNELYDSNRENLLATPTSRWVFTSLGDPVTAHLSATSIERVYGGSLRTSVSQLETYATCPFQHFAKYTLGLRERAEAALAPIDVGQIHHAILEDFVRTLSTHNRSFGQLDDGELLAGLRESCRRVGTQLPAERIGSSARDAYLLRRSASYLARILRAQRAASKQGGARPRAAEMPFGFDKREQSLPALVLTTPDGRQIHLRGFIDRVDLAELGDELLGIVIDYKRTRDKRLPLDRVYHGLSLQLLAYLLVLHEHGRTLTGRPIRPAAGLYVSLLPNREVVDHPSKTSQRQVALGGTYRPRGVIDTDCIDALDTGAGAAGWSDHYAIYRKTDGTFGHPDQADTADDSSFRALLEHTRGKLGELADSLLNGMAAVRPYRIGGFSPCSWCPMTSVCRFEMGVSEVQFLDALKRSDVFRKLGDIQTQRSGED